MATGASVSLGREYPFLRNLRSPLDDTQLTPLDRRCETVQFGEPLTKDDHERLSGFMRQYPDVALRAYSHLSGPLPNLAFLKQYSFLKHLAVDVLEVESLEGIECLASTLESFSFVKLRSRKVSLNVLDGFSRLQSLHLDGHVKGMEAVSGLLALEQLTLRSISLPDLSLLLPLKKLWWLAIKLGGTRNLSLLPRIGYLKYLELWMIRGVTDLGMIGDLLTLQNLFLEALRNVEALPSFKKLAALRRVTIDNLKGLVDLKPVAEAPLLGELFLLRTRHLRASDLEPFVGHPSLRCATIDIGGPKKKEQTNRLLGLNVCGQYKGPFDFR